MSDFAPVQVVRAALAAEPIALGEHEDLVTRAAGGRAGAVVGFVGAVRNHDGGREVTRLDYSAHPTAPDVLRQVVEGVVTQMAGVRAVAVSHRVGDLAIGDVAFVVTVAADHRRAAFETCSELVDQVKAQLPVWKHQHFGDGSDEWVGSA
ncbi:molybdenum cofactor biosynthesis protein MoaE [Gordonia sp. Z-3]|uniref:molybdenum cofactor biosynthesis protein MoaE n=1 Tax=unclassified Gordonia (in: high G+C Gram-positive bacteria) TaxID=2657482 RepID=UPI000C547F6D|nr:MULTISPECIES: molybdenum cofactor biosynthesis protein MoaE [unclassified Gordonia (in: high G+C Gram-positive bacteria)]MAU84841.1 molybdenum cofactor biosynthesis protein MoaE [Gordonia sp. (in: high G+C Gram-positive bacteria)]MED5800061.1 molybdenum cofactor biosynthesis protein MoaE [Gordonia sp. Z-3]